MSQIPPSPPPPGPGASRTNRTPNPAEIVVLAGAGVVLIFSFLAFYSASFGDASLNAWDTGLFPVATLIVLFAVAAGVLVGLGLLGASVPDRILSFTRAQLLLVCGAFATLQSVAYMILDQPGADLGIGFWFMLLGSIAVLVGAIMMLRETANA